MSKIRVRLTAKSMEEAERIRNHFLKSHPQIILAKPKKYVHKSKHGFGTSEYFVIFGDYEFNKIRRRKNDM